MTPKEKLSTARLMACRKAPYLSAALLAMVPRETKGLNTLAVTAKAIMLWDPEAVERWTVEELASVLIHEVSHILRDHHPRSKFYTDLNPMLWNLAGDAAINVDILAMGLKLPEEPVTPQSIGSSNGKTTEEYYAHLCQQQQAQGDEGESEEGSTPGSGGKCGSCAGNPVDGEPGDNDADGRSKVELQRVAKQVAEAIRQESAKGRGLVPGGWEVWADQQLTPAKVPWRQKLQRACRASFAARSGAHDYKFDRPSRRQSGVGFGDGKPIMPRMYAPMPHVAIGIDTSGSMGTECIVRAVSESEGALKALGAPVTFIACDSALHAEPRRVRNCQELIKELRGGGGTDFRPVFEAVGKLRPRPDVFIFITDGGGPAPSYGPEGIRTIWVLVGAHRCRPSFEDGGDGFGEFIEVDDEEQNFKRGGVR